MTYFYDEDQREYMKNKIKQFELENSIGSTLESQREANNHRIKQIEQMMDRRKYEEEPYKSTYYDLTSL